MGLPELTVTVSNFGASTVLTLDGYLNALTVDILESTLSSVLATDAHRIVMDCSGLSFTSSAGLRVFLATVKRMKSRGGSCAFAALTPTVYEVLEMAGFVETMEIHSTRNSALFSQNL
jgi:anti-anti-sigma factor